MQIKTYLSEQLKEKKSLGPLLNSFGLRYLDVERFKEKFGEMSPGEMAEFILHSDNAYEIGQWSYRQRNPAGRERCYEAKKNIDRDNGGRF